MTDLARIAEGLSDAQRRIVLNAPSGGNWFPTCWEGWRGLFRSLYRLGLVYPREPGTQVLSPLGEQVRRYLMENDK